MQQKDDILKTYGRSFLSLGSVSSRLHLAETRRETSVLLATSVNGNVSADNANAGRISAFSVAVLDADEEQMSSILGPASSTFEGPAQVNASF